MDSQFVCPAVCKCELNGCEFVKVIFLTIMVAAGVEVRQRGDGYE